MEHLKWECVRKRNVWGRLLEMNFSLNTVLESIIFLVFLKVTYEAIVADSGVGDLVRGGTAPTGKWEPKH